MPRRPRKVIVLAVLAALAAATISAAGPFTGSASANACKRFGDVTPLKLTHAQARRSIRCFLNRTRTHRGLHRLDKSSRLAGAAQDHTQYMNSHGCFDHQCPGEPNLVARLSDVNYIVGSLLGWLVGENIAWGERGLGTPRAIFHAWMHSPEHKHNILEPKFEQVGVGFATGWPGNAKGNGATYTTDFGMRQG
jgi:uncharacterized protein YkwD